MADDLPRTPLRIGAEVRLKLRLSIDDVAYAQLGLPRSFILDCGWPAFKALDCPEECAPGTIRGVVAIKEARE